MTFDKIVQWLEEKGYHYKKIKLSSNDFYEYAIHAWDDDKKDCYYYFEDDGSISYAYGNKKFLNF